MGLSNKYSDAEIRTMADFVWNARNTGNPLYPQFLSTMHLITGIDPHELERRIESCVRTGKW